MKRWDIFCKIVDNYGDIGVCWRLAKQLQQEHGLQVRLWVDDLAVAQRLIPALDLTQAIQTHVHIEIVHWHAQANVAQAADVVIEAFACDLPAPYLTAMRAQKSKWINLEYLSAETWVSDFHAKPSPKQGLTRYFYFPGFVAQSGGLIRERDTLASHHRLSQHPTSTAVADVRPSLQWPNLASLPGIISIKVSLFCYPHAPIASLLETLANAPQSVTCLIPESSILPRVADFFRIERLKVGDSFTKQQLNVHVLPFLSQPAYDELLSVCDINFVRGEDSWVRAIWAGKPFVWQPYQQEENAHLVKLNAFLTYFYDACPASKAVDTLHQAWATGEVTAQVWKRYFMQLDTIHAHTLHKRQRLAEQADLATQLIDFCRRI